MEAISYEDFVKTTKKIQQSYIDSFHEFETQPIIEEAQIFIKQYLDDNTFLGRQVVAIFLRIAVDTPLVKVDKLSESEIKAICYEFIGDPYHYSKFEVWLELNLNQEVFSQKKTFIVKAVLYFIWIYIDTTNNQSSHLKNLVGDCSNLAFLLGRWEQVYNQVNSSNHAQNQSLARKQDTDIRTTQKSTVREIAILQYMIKHNIEGSLLEVSQIIYHDHVDDLNKHINKYKYYSEIYRNPTETVRSAKDIQSFKNNTQFKRTFNRYLERSFPDLSIYDKTSIKSKIEELKEFLIATNYSLSNLP